MCGRLCLVCGGVEGAVSEPCLEQGLTFPGCSAVFFLCTAVMWWWREKEMMSVDVFYKAGEPSWLMYSLIIGSVLCVCRQRWFDMCLV